MGCVSATLVMGWRLDQLCEIRKVDGPKKFDENTGKPRKNIVDALFVLGKEAPSNDLEEHPGCWDDLLCMSIFYCGNGDNYPSKGLRSYKFDAFVAGVLIAASHGGIIEVPAKVVGGKLDLLEYENQAWTKLTTLCKSLSIDPATLPKPKVYMVCYYSY